MNLFSYASQLSVFYVPLFFQLSGKVIIFFSLGICYVGFSNIYTRIFFLLIPYFIFIAVAGFFRWAYFLFLCLLTSIFLRQTNYLSSGIFCCKFVKFNSINMRRDWHCDICQNSQRFFVQIWYRLCSVLVNDHT
jgi:hypothetical protein